jgi:DNA-binding MarR family transcriptional regulator
MSKNHFNSEIGGGYICRTIVYISLPNRAQNETRRGEIPIMGSIEVVPNSSTNVLTTSTTFSALGDLLFGQTRGRILALLFGRSDQSIYIRQIARETRTSAGSVQRELEALANVGLIQRTDSGRVPQVSLLRPGTTFARSTKPA